MILRTRTGQAILWQGVRQANEHGLCTEALFCESWQGLPVFTYRVILTLYCIKKA